MKRLLGFLMIFLMVTTPLHSLSYELSSFESNCCCEELCDCDHSHTQETIIRNIKCGDNGGNQYGTSIHRQTLSGHFTVIFPNEYKTFFKLLKPKLTTLFICSVDPPPPKKILINT